MAADRDIRNTIKSIFAASKNEANCEECFEELDKFVEMVEAGEDVTKILPRVEAHLGWCLDCSEQYEALVSLLRSEAAQDE